MLLTVDIGNTNVTIGVFEGERLATTIRMVTDTRRVMDEYVLLLLNLLKLHDIERQQIDSACICSVVPPLTGVFEEACRTCFNVTPLVVSAGVRTGLPILYDNPRDVGADRIVDAVAALRLYQPPLIVVDLGTATVFDAVSRQGEYLGGAIAPGINLAAEALFLNTSQLRRVELTAPKKAIGHNTVTAIQSGLLLGYASLITGMVQRFKDEIGQDARVIGTGGLVRVIAEEAKVFDAINPDLTLIGLRLIYEMNQPRSNPSKPPLQKGDKEGFSPSRRGTEGSQEESRGRSTGR
ncbi:MAG: type III pantothenate kinase [SAR202 cluster bacterium]|nr:type III pantothenate kinase [SAR202 cluster bacterium]